MTATNRPSPTAASAQPPRPWLVADIGGTNARFGWLAEGAAQVEHVHKLRGVDHPGVAAAASAYLKQIQQELGDGYSAPRAAAFAVATAVEGDRIAFTNSAWSFSHKEIQHRLGLPTLLMLNDFAALALSLPGLKTQQLQPFGGGKAVPGGALAVVGPGTGLGVAGLVRHGDCWVAVPGEGGHATLAAADDFDAAVLAAARLAHDHVSAERLLSGIGLPTLQAAVAAVLGQSVAVLTAPEIVACGLDANAVDPVCSRTLDTFCALLGGFAGDAALTFGARGGLYIGGGIVPRLGERFFRSRFRERFEAKGRFRDYLQAIPTAVITDTLAALDGAARALQQHVESSRTPRP